MKRTKVNELRLWAWHKMENLGLDLGAIEGEMFGFCEQNKNLVAFVSTCKNPSKRSAATQLFSYQDWGTASCLLATRGSSR